MWRCVQCYSGNRNAEQNAKIKLQLQHTDNVVIVLLNLCNQIKIILFTPLYKLMS